jgi:hypothetical protein
MTGSRIFLAAALALAFATAEARAADGQATGEIAGVAFDLPVTCGPFGSGFEARSHDIFFDRNESDVEPAFQIAVFGGNLAVTFFGGGKKYQFGSRSADTEARPLVFDSTIRSKKHGDYAAAFTVECP